MTIDTELEPRTDAARVLRSQIDPARVVDAPASRNGAIDRRPALVVRCATTAHVQAAVRAARVHGLPLSVRGRTGRATRPGGLVVDLGRMRQVDVRGRTAIVDGGATVAEVAEAADRHGLAAVTGSTGDAGIAALTLGGGYGPLNGRFGLATDNLLGAEVVLADGRVAHTGTDPDLLWALRGGGGNFGVVTALRLALRVVPAVLTATIAFPWSQADDVVRGYADLAGRAPDALTADLVLRATPGGEPSVLVRPVWSGALDAGRPVVEEFLRLGTPLRGSVDVLSPLELLRRTGPRAPRGRHHASGTRTLPTLTPAAVAALLAAVADPDAPGATLGVHHLHGRAATTPLAAGAFAARRDHFMIDLAGAEPPGQDTWVARTGGALAEHALPGGYPNLLGPDDVAQADHAYGSNTARLLAVKARLDPDGVFTATPLPAGRAISRPAPVRRRGWL